MVFKESSSQVGWKFWKTYLSISGESVTKIIIIWTLNSGIEAQNIKIDTRISLYRGYMIRTWGKQWEMTIIIHQTSSNLDQEYYERSNMHDHSSWDPNLKHDLLDSYHHRQYESKLISSREKFLPIDLEENLNSKLWWEIWLLHVLVAIVCSMIHLHIHILYA